MRSKPGREADILRHTKVLRQPCRKGNTRREAFYRELYENVMQTMMLSSVDLTKTGRRHDIQTVVIRKRASVVLVIPEPKESKIQITKAE